MSSYVAYTKAWVLVPQKRCFLTKCRRNAILKDVIGHDAGRAHAT